MLAGQHTVTSVSASETEAEELAEETFDKLTAFMNDFIQNYQFYRFMVSKVGGPARIKEHRDLIGVPIPLVWCIEKRWLAVPQAPKLAKMTTQIHAS